MIKELWNEKKRNYPYNVLDMVFGEIRKPEVVDSLRYGVDTPKLAEGIDTLVKELPSEIRRIFLMYVKGGMSFETIAKTEELPVEVVRDRVALTLRHLRKPEQSKLLQDYLGYPMPMGAVIGDIIGSRFQFDDSVSNDFDFFTLKNTCSVNGLAAIAVAKALSEAKDGSDEEIKVALSSAMDELAIQTPVPDESIAGAASFIGWCARNEQEVKRLTSLLTELSRNPKKALNNAEAVAMAIHLAQNGMPKNQICFKIRHRYYHKIFPQTSFLQGYIPRLIQYDSLYEMYRSGKVETVPAAVACAFDGKDFEDAIRKAVFLGGNSSAVVAITGAIAEAFYGGVPREMKLFAKMYFPDEVWTTLKNIRWSVR